MPQNGPYGALVRRLRWSLWINTVGWCDPTAPRWLRKIQTKWLGLDSERDRIAKHGVSETFRLARVVGQLLEALDLAMGYVEYMDNEASDKIEAARTAALGSKTDPDPAP